MKKLLLLFFFSILFLNSKAQTSVYHPFPDSNASWNQSQGWTDGLCHHDRHFTNFIDGDTIIGGKVYHKMIESGYEISFDCGNGYYFYGYSFAIRQDTSLKKVWIYDGIADTILYDFNLHVGDTLDRTKIYWGDVMWGPYIVSTIDSVLINGQYRNRYNYRGSGFQDTSIIEGIGGVGGLVSAPSYFEWNAQLSCFKQNDTTLYPYSTYSCNIISEVKKLSDNIPLLISPNPASDKITVSGYHSSGKEVMVEIYNIMGERIIQLQTISNNLKPETTLDVSSLSAGVYVMMVYEGEKVSRAKFVKE